MIDINVIGLCFIITNICYMVWTLTNKMIWDAHMRTLAKDLFDITEKHNQKFLNLLSSYTQNNEQNIINIMMNNKREQDKSIADIRLNLAKLKEDIK